jgi:hypothetical protein
MPNEITDDDLALLGELGVETEPTRVDGYSAKEKRIIAGFEDIERFFEEHGRIPQHGEHRDIFERLYAERLDQICSSAECRAILAGSDSHGLLGPGDEAEATRVKEEDMSDRELLASLGVEVAPMSDITSLTHVRSREEINAAEEIAQRNPCRDFSEFKPLFEKAQGELETGERRTVKYQDKAEIKKGDLFILNGQKVYVADLGDSFINDYGRPDRRLRVIYDNGTESDLLLRSLQRALNKDEGSRRITQPGFGPLFSDEEEEDDLPSGYIYVLRSRSDHPFVAKNRSVIHKIGVTGGDVKSRIVNAKKDPTYLLADVEIVTTFKLFYINRKRLEALIHKFFANARLDLVLNFGGGVEPREWFLVPLPVIEETIERLRDGSIANYRYNPQSARIEERASEPPIHPTTHGVS